MSNTTRVGAVQRAAVRTPNTRWLPHQWEAVVDSSIRALEAVRAYTAAAKVRRDLTLEPPVHLRQVLAMELGSAESKLLRALQAIQVPSDDHPVKWRELVAHTSCDDDHLADFVRELMNHVVAANDALAEMAKSVAQQLVGKPGKLVIGSEIAEMLGVTEEAVRQRYQSGKLIAILREGRERGRGFPIFQAWDGIAGAPLEQILRALGYDGPHPDNPIDAADAFQFFTSRNELLGGFTPVEVLTGAGLLDPGDHEAAQFLAKPHAERVEFVASVALASAEVRGE